MAGKSQGYFRRPFGLAEERRESADTGVVVTRTETTESEFEAELQVGAVEGWIEVRLRSARPASIRITREEAIALAYKVEAAAQSAPTLQAWPEYQPLPDNQFVWPPADLSWAAARGGVIVRSRSRETVTHAFALRVRAGPGVVAIELAGAYRFSGSRIELPPEAATHLAKEIWTAAHKVARD